MCVGQVGTNVAPPDDACASTRQMAGHTSRLGIVEDHDVAGLYPTAQRSRVGFKGGAVAGVFIPTEKSGIPRCSMEAVVQSLRDGKELGIGIDDDPAGVDFGIVGVADEEVQHLRHAPAGSGRAHVPQPPTDEGATGVFGGFLEASGALWAQ
jgi:hypothetical protein